VWSSSEELLLGASAMKMPTSRTLWAELRPTDPTCKRRRRRGGGEVGDGVSGGVSRQHTGEL
jgi:hypothetical protein